MKNNSKNLLWLFFIAILVLAGCSGGGSSSGDNGNNTIPSDGTTATVISSDGGTATSQDGKVSIVVPQGAISTDIALTITSRTESASVGKVYEFGPSGTVFQTPVTVDIAYELSELPANVSEDRLYLVTETTDGYMQALTDIVSDPSRRVVQGKLSHFSPVWITYDTPIEVNNRPITTNDIPIATSFRMPIGDSRDLSNTSIACNDAISQSLEDVGKDIDLLTIDSYGNNYPKIEFNALGASNKWIVATAFNKDQYLTNYDTGTPRQYSSNGDFHPGEDWNDRAGGSSDSGKPIHAIADGIVLFAQKQWSTNSNRPDKTRGFGNIAVIGHKLSDGSVIASVYAHMKDVSPCLVGDTVSKGDIIGLVGDTGLPGTSAHHLHFEIIKTKPFDNASSDELKNTPMIDSSSNQIYIRHYEEETRVGGWYWPGTDTEFISNNYYDPSKFIRDSTNEFLGGNRIVFVSERDGNDEIYVMDADGSNQINLTNNMAKDYSFPPIWSPNGTKIAFVSDRDGDADIYVMDADGSNQINLTNHTAGDYSPSWSPNGAKIAFMSAHDSDYTVIYVMDADGSNLIRLTNNNGSSPVWSPNGTKIAFLSHYPDNYYNMPEICVMDADGANQTRLTYNAVYDSNPVWSPDGAKIAFRSNTEIYVMDANGGSLIRLTNNMSWDGLPVWSPTGTKIAFVSYRDGNNEIYVMDADGSNQINLTNNTVEDYEISWSPDGAKIAFQSLDPINGPDIYVVDANGSNLTRLTVNGGNAPAWQP